MVTTLTDEVVFFEEQKIRHVWWVMLLIYGVAALMWYGFIQQIILGGNLLEPIPALIG